ncbi:MAG: vanadium-dependent haloperoxidase [Verrucomicrobiales bacterium]
MQTRTALRVFTRFLPLTFALLCSAVTTHGQSIARIWNEENLDAIRLDFPNPPVHARNLFHTSVAMWDAWAAYDALAVGYVYQKKHGTPDRVSARNESISYAAYRVLASRYSISVSASVSLAAFRERMVALGYDPDITTTEGSSPPAIGNKIAATVLSFADSDRSREKFLYTDFTYFPINNPLIISETGTSMFAPNRWQPLAFDVAFTQNGLVADKVQIFVGSHWGGVRPFAMQLEENQTLYHDPGLPPQLNGDGDAAFKSGFMDVIRFSSLLDSDQGKMIDISPGARGNNTLGSNDGTGHPLNPETGQSYEPNMVNVADYGRVIAEFWADGPHSETPPGHWNTLANEVTAHPDFSRRINGTGPVLDPLEWDVKMYFAMNGALHDAAITAWGCKRKYDYVRPISAIRYCGGRGQSSDPNGPSFHQAGLPLEDNLVEVITAETAAEGLRHAHLASYIGKVAIRSWRGEPADPTSQHGGVDWILAEDWLPYQRDTFVTPAFAGYVSGHSAFSRSAAEVLAAMTGSPYFPGGMSGYLEPQGGLEFEFGPTTPVQLQWATYFDASDEAGISRLYGGIHVPADDGPGRIMGAKCGIDAYALASQYANAVSSQMRGHRC